MWSYPFHFLTPILPYAHHNMSPSQLHDFFSLNNQLSPISAPSVSVDMGLPTGTSDTYQWECHQKWMIPIPMASFSTVLPPLCFCPSENTPTATVLAVSPGWEHPTIHPRTPGTCLDDCCFHVVPWSGPESLYYRGTKKNMVFGNQTDLALM